MKEQHQRRSDTRRKRRGTTRCLSLPDRKQLSEQQIAALMPPAVYALLIRLEILAAGEPTEGTHPHLVQRWDATRSAAWQAFWDVEALVEDWRNELISFHSVDTEEWGRLEEQ